jgi:hypothetical protein
MATIYVESPLDRIVNVNFGAPVVVAEMPAQFFYLLSLDPADPPSGIIGDELMISTKIHDEHATIPVSDYRTAPLNTTANLYAGLNIIDGIADTDRLRVGTTYPVSGTFIPSGTTMVYNGGSAGTLSTSTTVDPGEVVLGTPVVIGLPIWRLGVGVTNVATIPPGPGGPATIATAEQSAGDYQFGDANYVRSPFILYRNPRDPTDSVETRNAQTDAAYASLAAQGYPGYALWAAHFDVGDQLHNGVTLPAWTVTQFWGPISEACDVFLINMSTTKLVQIIQTDYDLTPGYFGGTTVFLPGWQGSGGLKLTGYPKGTTFSLTVDAFPAGSWGPIYSLKVEAKNPGDIDPITGNPRGAVPTWTERIVPSQAPSVQHEIGRFNAQGLV